MRGLSKLPSIPGRPATQSLIFPAAFSTFGGGGGRGRGRGSTPPPPNPPPSRVPGQPHTDSDLDSDPFTPPGLGHGRGHPILPSSPVLPSFSSWISPSPSSPATSGRGRGHPPPPSIPASTGRGRGFPSPPPQDPIQSPDPQPKKPIFLNRDDLSASALPGAGRGKPTKQGDPIAKPKEENRHIRPKLPSSVPVRRDPQPTEQQASPGGRGRRGRGGRGMGRGRGRGGRFGRGRRDSDAAEDSALYLGDNADGERLEKRLGEENMKQLVEGFEEMSTRVLPSPLEDAYLDALHTNNMIEYEPEYLVDFDNPDIDEKPPMPLEEALEKAKPFLIAYEGIQSQEEWEEAVKDVMERLPHMKELMDMYCGPNRVTAKQQQQELERVAKTIPDNVPSSVKRFTDRAVLSLQSNPGWGWDKKCQFMDKLAREVSQHYR